MGGGKICGRGRYIHIHIHDRHDKVLTGSFAYPTRQNYNRVKTSMALQNLHRIDVIEPWLQLFPPVVRQQQRARELNHVQQIQHTHDNIRRGKEFSSQKEERQFLHTRQVLTGSFPYPTRQNCNRVKNFYGSAELTYKIDVIESWLQLFPPVVRQQQRARELDLVTHTTDTTKYELL